MCYTDTFKKRFTCGATTGQLVIANQLTGVAAASTKTFHHSRYMTQRRQEYGQYHNQMAAIHQLPLDFGLWLAQVRQLPQCNVNRFTPGVMKCARHCRLDDYGQDACPQVNTAHKYPRAPGANPIPFNSMEDEPMSFSILGISEVEDTNMHHIDSASIENERNPREIMFMRRGETPADSLTLAARPCFRLGQRPTLCRKVFLTASSGKGLRDSQIPAHHKDLPTSTLGEIDVQDVERDEHRNDSIVLSSAVDATRASPIDTASPRVSSASRGKQGR
ncbi:hypothetical protein C8R46DRAFT_1284006 [Mycena filopes]|nr:hypothetical protein C8R46DRAFT_1194175 [Mycena filopes]KAJ7161692.1 hypothetical protein C8R46DRAFT_1284006 [Mycena filopes]